MRDRTACRPARRDDLGLTVREHATLAPLATPPRIQAFVNALRANHEPDGETVRSVRGVLRHREAHCIEAALVAACALWIHGERPLVMHLDCAPSDYPHVVALFRRDRLWGAISKSNGAWLRYREPVYRTLRELAMSYFHEYFDTRGRKTLRSYSGSVRSGTRGSGAVGHERGVVLGGARPDGRAAALPARVGRASGRAVAARSVRVPVREVGPVSAAGARTARQGG